MNKLILSNLFYIAFRFHDRSVHTFCTFLYIFADLPYFFPFLDIIVKLIHGRTSFKTRCLLMQLPWRVWRSYKQISALVQHVSSLADDFARLPSSYIFTFVSPFLRSGIVNVKIANIAVIIMVRDYRDYRHRRRRRHHHYHYSRLPHSLDRPRHRLLSLVRYWSVTPVWPRIASRNRPM